MRAHPSAASGQSQRAEGNDLQPADLPQGAASRWVGIIQEESRKNCPTGQSRTPHLLILSIRARSAAADRAESAPEKLSGFSPCTMLLRPIQFPCQKTRDYSRTCQASAIAPAKPEVFPIPVNIPGQSRGSPHPLVNLERPSGQPCQSQTSAPSGKLSGSSSPASAPLSASPACRAMKNSSTTASTSGPVFW